VSDTWGDWLRDQFDRHRTIRRPADLMRAGGQKPNGRPVIDPSTITQWLRGRRPSYELAVATAQAFGVSTADALAAAGYDVPVAAESTRGQRDRDGGLVGPADEDAPLFRYQRPPGLTDQEWDDLRRQHADYWDWLVERAARER
jgi:transcriptional regulator with XRE-family HTH domain